MMKKLIKIFGLLSILVFAFNLPAQDVYQHVSNKNIYDFVDELANAGLISINSAVQPYSRMFIAERLAEAKAQDTLLNQRQKKELDFYLLEYKPELDPLPDYNPKFDVFKKNENLAFAINPLGGYYKDQLFTLSVKPIWGINYFNNENGSIYHRWGGAEAYAYVGKNWGFYASLRDNNETEMISGPDFFTLRSGGAYKGLEYSEMRGGVTYSWKWGSFGLIKDHLKWGNNEHGAMIFSDRPPSVTKLRLNIKPVKWFELNYYHGWLVSMEVDSVRSYYSTDPAREVYRPKYIAANLFTFTPWRKLNVSLGNSIVYSDINVHPAYLIPVMFYKSIDHTLNQKVDNQNSQMFLDVSSRNIKNLHLYGTLYIDELKIGRINDPNESNFWSTKAGAKATNLAVPNLWLNLEYSMSYPITYQHRVPTLTFESNYYNLGYYLQDNSQEIYAAIGYKFLRGLHLSAAYTLAQHGPDYNYTLDGTVTKHPFIERVAWQNENISFSARYEFISNAYLFAEFITGEVSGDEDMVMLYTPEFFRGKTDTLFFGFNIGF
ncbi:MAG: hypothetical protein ACNA7V_07195 [Bacteroidales bacterium]